MISESQNAASVNYLIERYFSSFLDDIYQNNGNINETAGGGLVIIFQDADRMKHAAQVTHTTLAIRNKTQQININLEGEYGPVQVNILKDDRYS